MRCGHALLCAWVLWHHNLILNPDKPTKSFWRIVDATDTKSECLASAMQQLVAFSDKDSRARFPAGSISVMVESILPNGTRSSHDFSCLPAGTDPRDK
jgi:hypothetical protein